MLSETEKEAFDRLLCSELVVATGCTEPIAIAYCAAKAREVLGAMPDTCLIECSGNIIKNVKSVTVPGTGGMAGLDAAAAAGIAVGDASRGLDVIGSLRPEDSAKIKKCLAHLPIELGVLDSGRVLHIRVSLSAGENSASVEIADHHTNIIKVTKNGQELGGERENSSSQVDCAFKGSELLSIDKIYEYASTADMSAVTDAVRRQIEYNLAISAEGLKNDWGARVGKTISATGSDVRTRMTAAAAAGSDARMNGCLMPVVINCGSGNQGITSAVPVAVYAQELEASEDELIRSLCLGNLIAIRQKSGMGALSAYCGAVCAATGAASAIAYLDGADADCISRLIINSVGTISGMVCDGAKSSCATKIALSLSCAFTAYDLAKQGIVFDGGDGIVADTAEKTIDNVARMARDGMKQTDAEILNIMIGK